MQAHNWIAIFTQNITMLSTLLEEFEHFQCWSYKWEMSITSSKKYPKLIEYNKKQAGAELCQAQEKLGL